MRGRSQIDEKVTLNKYFKCFLFPCCMHGIFLETISDIVFYFLNAKVLGISPVITAEAMYALDVTILKSIKNLKTTYITILPIKLQTNCRWPRKRTAEPVNGIRTSVALQSLCDIMTRGQLGPA